MLNKFYLDKKSCSLFITLMNISFKAIYFLMIISFVYIVWNYKETYFHLFDPKTLSKAHEDQWSDYKYFFKIISIDTIYFVLKILVLQILIKLFNSIKIPSIWIKKWDDENTISDLFGRYLCQHIRLYKNLTFKNFNDLHQFVKKENKILNIVSNDINLKYIFTKYDKNFSKDK